MRYLFVCISLSMYGCVIAPDLGEDFRPAPAPTENEARIYIQWPTANNPFRGKINVYLDDKQVAVLAPDGYTTFLYPGGVYKLTVEREYLDGDRKGDMAVGFENARTYTIDISPYSKTVWRTFDASMEEFGLQVKLNEGIDELLEYRRYIAPVTDGGK